MRNLFFDVLPAHPHLESYECLTSYCIRIGQANMVKSINGIANLLFPETYLQQAQKLSDIPPLSVSSTAKATNQTEERILNSTFYYMGINFGRSTKPRNFSRFFDGAISPFLRYCPICVREKGYYSIFWRFNHIAGCLEHQCKLVELCPCCGNRIPLFKPPFQMGFCPLCSSRLDTGAIDYLDNVNLHQVSKFEDDLRLFLSPAGYPLDLYVGGYLKLYRVSQKITAKSLARRIGKNNDFILELEQRRNNFRSGKFTDYLTYLEMLHVTFSDLVSNSSPLGENISAIEEGNETGVIQPVNIDFDGEKESSSNQTKTKVMLAIEQLRNQGEVVNLKNVAQYAGIPRSRFYFDAELRELLPMKNDRRLIRHVRKEEELISRVDSISCSLINQNDIVTCSMVKDILNVPQTTISYYSRVRKKIYEIRDLQVRRMEEEYLDRLNLVLTSGSIDFIPYLSNFARALGLSTERLAHFPRLKAKLKVVCKDLRKQQTSNGGQHLIDDSKSSTIDGNNKFLPRTIPINGRDGKKFVFVNTKTP